MKKLDISGKKCNRLTAIRLVGVSRAGKSVWLCACECGREVEVIGSHLLNGNTKSCGCLKAEVTGARRRTHGETKGPTYRVWQNMKTRCTNPRVKAWGNYGGRGIAVCDRWLSSYESFVADMGYRPSPDHELDRIDVNGNYEPANCRWVSIRDQARNKRTTRWIEVDGDVRSLAEWADLSPVTESCIRRRLAAGVPAKVAVFSAPRKSKHSPCQIIR
jgi:hypothetical protein